MGCDGSIFSRIVFILLFNIGERFSLRCSSIKYEIASFGDFLELIFNASCERLLANNRDASLAIFLFLYNDPKEWDASCNIGILYFCNTYSDRSVTDM